MKVVAVLLLCGWAGVLCAAERADRVIPLDRLKPGIEFQSRDIQAQQRDEFDNPGMLWVTRGERLWKATPGGGARSCSGCHGDAAVSMKGVAARYPQTDAATGRLQNIEARINRCRTEQQKAEAWRAESDELIGMTAYVSLQSRGMPKQVTIDAANQANFERGRAFYYLRQGQINLSCAQCHEDNWGRRLLGETISQGHGTSYPIYRLEWQSAGSLHRRFRSCASGVRAEMLPVGSPEYVDLELFLAWRAQGLPLDPPGVRR